MKRLVSQGKHGAARKIREGLVDKYGVGVNIKAGESWPQYFKRIGTKILLPSVAVESGEKLKTEGEQKESFTKMETESGAVKSQCTESFQSCTTSRTIRTLHTLTLAGSLCHCLARQLRPSRVILTYNFDELHAERAITPLPSDRYGSADLTLQGGCQ